VVYPVGVPAFLAFLLWRARVPMRRIRLSYQQAVHTRALNKLADKAAAAVERELAYHTTNDVGGVGGQRSPRSASVQSASPPPWPAAGVASAWPRDEPPSASGTLTLARSMRDQLPRSYAWLKPVVDGYRCVQRACRLARMPLLRVTDVACARRGRSQPRLLLVRADRVRAQDCARRLALTHWRRWHRPARRGLSHRCSAALRALRRAPLPAAHRQRPRDHLPSRRLHHAAARHVPAACPVQGQR
jgi:hypothetical protein